MLDGEIDSAMRSGQSDHSASAMLISMQRLASRTGDGRLLQKTKKDSEGLRSKRVDAASSPYLDLSGEEDKAVAVEERTEGSC